MFNVCTHVLPANTSTSTDVLQAAMISTPLRPILLHNDSDASMSSSLFMSRTDLSSLSVMATMKTLIAKFPEGYEGWERDHEELIREHNAE